MCFEANKVRLTDARPEKEVGTSNLNILIGLTASGSQQETSHLATLLLAASAEEEDTEFDVEFELDELIEVEEEE